MTRYMTFFEWLIYRLTGKKCYYRVTHIDGGSFIATESEAVDFLINEENRDDYTLTKAYMSPAKFESLSEFEGF